VRLRNPACHRLLVARLQALDLVPHEALKAMVRDARLVVRTGEASPYANVVLRCGVPF
jgi:D-ribose pyranase